MMWLYILGVFIIKPLLADELPVEQNIHNLVLPVYGGIGHADRNFDQPFAGKIFVFICGILKIKDPGMVYAVVCREDKICKDFPFGCDLGSGNLNISDILALKYRLEVGAAGFHRVPCSNKILEIMPP